MKGRALRIDTVLIAGPTSSGKTRAAVDVALRLGGEVVNADAMQVYRDIPILSAQPTPEERRGVRHHLFGYLDAATRCSAGRWASDAAAVIADIRSRDRVAVVAGGTGLYFRALVDGLSEIPPAPGDVADRMRAKADREGLAAFRAALVARDPSTASIAPTDRQRLIRAATVLEATGVGLAAWTAVKGKGADLGAARRVVILPERAALYAACDRRFEEMMAAGALGEAEALAARRLDARLPAMKAVGAAELTAYLAGDLTLEAAVARSKQNTRRLAKRQMTWFRNQTLDWQRAFGPEEAIAALVQA